LENQQIVIFDQIISVQPYILPHESKISRQDYEKYEGEGGYIQNQGFYIYRNKRLIIKGTWFRLLKKIDLNKLIRIRVDIPNTLDYLWKIDVKKSQASPPEVVRRELLQVIEKIEEAGHRVYHHKGKVLSSKVINPVWKRRAVGGNIIYEINREHPIILKLLLSIPEDQKALFNNIITMFEKCFPFDIFFNDVMSNPKQIENPRMDEKAMEMLLDLFIEAWKSNGLTNEAIVEKVLSSDPFTEDSILINKLLNTKGFISHE